MSSHKYALQQKRTWLPREGFHADVLGSVIRQTLLNPTIILPILLLTKYTTKGRVIAAQYQRSSVFVKILAVLGTIRVLNNFLNRRVLNNGVTDTYDWHNRELVLVTGGSDGIGKEIVLGFSRRGVKVVVLDIQQLTYIPASNVTFVECDITSSSAIARAASEIRKAVGEPTVLINNAGVCRGKTLLDSTEHDVSLTFAINSVSHYTLAREFLPSMIRQNHGMVVTIASSAAWVTAPRMTEYAASKAAALAFHEGLAAELVSTYKADKVRTIVVNQGYTRTKLFQGFGVREDQFFAPSLHVQTVADAVIDKVLSGESGQIILPGFYKLLVANFRSLPTWMQHRGRFQLDNLMKDWKGRQVEMPNRGAH